MFKAVTTETMKMRDNNGKRYYIHIQYDGYGNPIRRQVSRVAKPNNMLAWYQSINLILIIHAFKGGVVINHSIDQRCRKIHNAPKIKTVVIKTTV